MRSLSICQESRLERDGLAREGYGDWRSAVLTSPCVTSAPITGRHSVKYRELNADEVRTLLEATDALLRCWVKAGAG